MEKDFLDLVNETYGLDTLVPNEVAPLILAHLGDALYEVIVRTIQASKGNRPIEKVHKASIKFVNAAAQARIIEYLEPVLSPEELSIYKRGRNTKSGTSAKNASINDYRKATGFEALIGYLYLQKRHERILELVKLGIDNLEASETTK